MSIKVFGCYETHLQTAESAEGVVAQGLDGVVVQVELGQSRTGGEAAVREGGEEVGAQPQNSEGGQDRSGAGGHQGNLTEPG